MQRSNQKLRLYSDVIAVWRDKTSSSTSRDSIGISRKTGSGNYCQTLSAIQRSDQKLGPFSVVIPVWRDKTSSSTSRDSIGISRKTASGNYCKTLSAIQRSDQKLWLFSAVIAVLRGKTCFSTSRDSIYSIRKQASETTVNIGARSNDWIKSYGLFQLQFRSCATRPPLQLVGIPYIVLGNRPLKITVHF
jgi:hypothetical protein